MYMKPCQISEGDTIGILAPSFVLKQENIQPSLYKLEQKGFKIKIAKNAFKDTYFYAATPEERAEDFNAMVEDNEVKMLLFGGGEVCNEILPFVNFEQITKKPKIICSYSDSTTILNAITALSGVVTYYGQSLRTFLDLTDYNEKCFQSAFCSNDQQVFIPNSKWEIIHDGKCEGMLVGGYLPNFALMMNSNYFKYDDRCKYILFMEDHIRFSSSAVISKYLSHIEQSGFMNQVVGFMIGHYSEEESPEFTDIFLRMARKYNIPAIKCDDFGHGMNNAIIPIGIYSELDAHKYRLSYKECPVNNK